MSTTTAPELTVTKICKLEEIVMNSGVCARVDGKQVAVFNTEQGVFAIDNYDPFSGANVLSRGIVGDKNGTIKVASPIYKQNFCLKTGQCLDDEIVKLAVYEVRINDGIVEVGAQLNA